MRKVKKKETTGKIRRKDRERKGRNRRRKLKRESEKHRAETGVQKRASSCHSSMFQLPGFAGSAKGSLHLQPNPTTFHNTTQPNPTQPNHPSNQETEPKVKVEVASRLLPSCQFQLRVWDAERILPGAAAGAPARVGDELCCH